MSFYSSQPQVGGVATPTLPSHQPYNSYAHLHGHAASQQPNQAQPQQPYYSAGATPATANGAPQARQVRAGGAGMTDSEKAAADKAAAEAVAMQASSSAWIWVIVIIFFLLIIIALAWFFAGRGRWNGACRGFSNGCRCNTCCSSQGNCEKKKDDCRPRNDCDDNRSNNGDHGNNQS